MMTSSSQTTRPRSPFDQSISAPTATSYHHPTFTNFLQQQQPPRDEIDKTIEAILDPNYIPSSHAPEVVLSSPDMNDTNLTLFSPELDSYDSNAIYTTLPQLAVQQPNFSSSSTSVPQLTVDFDVSTTAYNDWRDQTDASSLYSAESDNDALSVSSGIPSPNLGPNYGYQQQSYDYGGEFLDVPGRQSRRPSSAGSLNSLNGLEDLYLGDDHSDDGSYLGNSNAFLDPQYTNIIQLTSPMIRAIPSPSTSPLLNPDHSPQSQYSPSFPYTAPYPTPGANNVELPATAITQFLDPNCNNQGDLFGNMNDTASNFNLGGGQMGQRPPPPQRSISFDDLMKEFQVEYERGISNSESLQFSGSMQSGSVLLGGFGQVTPPESFSSIRGGQSSSSHSFTYTPSITSTNYDRSVNGAGTVTRKRDQRDRAILSPPPERRGSPVPPRPDAPPLPKPSQMAIKTEKQTLYMCPYPDCGKTFTRPYNLKSHYRSHTGERPFVCTHCPQTFSRKHDLKRHAKLHEGLKPYICPACSKAFARSDALRRHLKTGEVGKESACSLRLREREEGGGDGVEEFLRGLDGPGEEGEVKGEEDGIL